MSNVRVQNETASGLYALTPISPLLIMGYLRLAACRDLMMSCDNSVMSDGMSLRLKYNSDSSTEKCANERLNTSPFRYRYEYTIGCSVCMCISNLCISLSKCNVNQCAKRLNSC